MSRHQGLPDQTRACSPLPDRAEQSRPSGVFLPPTWTAPREDVGEAVSSVRDVWVPNIKGDREFAVPLRASLSKPGAGRIKVGEPPPS